MEILFKWKMKAFGCIFDNTFCGEESLCRRRDILGPTRADTCVGEETLLEEKRYLCWKLGKDSKETLLGERDTCICEETLLGTKRHLFQ
jgi:hypothetical protein